MKGKYFKHPARKIKYKHLMAERIRKNPCMYCPKKLKYLLKGDCDYVDCGGFYYIHKNNEARSLYKVKQFCVYKFAPTNTVPKHEFEMVL